MAQITTHIQPTLNAQEVARLFGCNEAKVEQLALTGELPGAKVGRGWVFVGPDMIEWLRERAATNQSKIKKPEPRDRRKPKRLAPPSLDM